MVSSTYLVALVALLGSSITSAHAHRNAAEEVRSRLRPRLEPKGSLNGPAAGCYTLPDKFKPPTGDVKNPVTGAMEPGAFSSFMTASRCSIACIDMKKEVVAVSGTDCYCGSLFPMKKNQVDDNKCNAKCKGFGDLMCGSLDDYWSFWASGLRSNVGNEEDPEEAKSSSIASASKASASAASKTAQAQATASPTESVDKGGQTVTLTPTASETDATEEKKGPNKVGIAVGVVVGVLVLAGAAGAFYFWYRKTRRNELEEEYKRQAAIAAFVAPSNESSSYDTRLDTAALRRMSDGSIADNQDYSRRILKVTNA